MSRFPLRLIPFLSGFMAAGIAVRLLSGFLLADFDARLATLFIQHAAAAGIALLLLRFNRTDSAIFLMGLEFAALSVRLVWLFGTEPLFHIHALVLAPVALLFTHYSRRRQVIYVTMPMILTMIVAMIPRHHTPTYTLPPDATEMWSLLNLALFMLACMGIILYHVKAMEEQTGKAELLAARRSRLIADLSHEWKTPLAAILAKVQSTLSRPRDEEVYRDALKLCERNALHLQSMTERMVTYQLAEQGHLTPQMEPVDLAQLLVILVQDLSPLAEEHGFTLKAESPRDLEINNDPLLLNLLLRNLCANAIQHAKGGDRIWIKVKTNPHLTITVEDNGPGIPAERLPELFEPFVRGDSARRREGGSVGLGLAIARETARALGMTLTARNRDEGGACFELVSTSSAEQLETRSPSRRIM